MPQQHKRRNAAPVGPTGVPPPPAFSPHAQAAFMEGFRHHREGRPAEAEAHYRRAIELGPAHADALHLLGVVCDQTGRPEEGIGFIRKALNLHDDVSAWHSNLGNALRHAGQQDEAVRHYEQALSLDPGNVDARYNLANAYVHMNRLDEAIAGYRHVLALNPSYTDAHNNLGNLMKARGQLDEAIVHYRAAIAQRPDFAMAHNNLGLALKARGSLEEAMEHQRRAAALRPDDTQALLNLGISLSEAGNTEGAIAVFEKVLALAPNDAETANSLGIALKDLGRVKEAEEQFTRAAELRPDDPRPPRNLGNLYAGQNHFREAEAFLRRALALDPSCVDAHISLGSALNGLGRPDEALACYRRATALAPNNADAHVNEAMTLLLKGDFANGWHQYEWRLRTSSARPFLSPSPAWNGGELRGRAILLRCEQGFGDSLQFIRYASLLKQRGGHVIVLAPEPLLRLFKSAPGVDAVASETEAPPPHDFHACLMSLPYLVKTRLENIPAPMPYLRPTTDAAALWASLLAPYPGFKVGLVWAGNSRIGIANANSVDKRRSMRLEQLAPLGAIPDIRFFSLQMPVPATVRHSVSEKTTEDANNAEDSPSYIHVRKKSEPQERSVPHLGFAPVDMMGYVKDFADTAALIANLDLVIGVDTSVIHLAGAMGKPVWTLSRFDGCWRWLQDRDDTPWYPTMRLFRQPKPGDWDSVIEAVRAELERAAARKSPA